MTLAAFTLSAFLSLRRLADMGLFDTLPNTDTAACSSNPSPATVTADIERECRSDTGTLWEIKVMFADGVETGRTETDTGVACAPGQDLETITECRDGFQYAVTYLVAADGTQTQIAAAPTGTECGLYDDYELITECRTGTLWTVQYTATDTGLVEVSAVDTGKACDDTAQWLDGCQNWCDPVAYKLDADGAIVLWRGNDGTVTAGDPGDIRLGGCPMPVKDVRSIWAFATVAGECPTLVNAAVTLLCYGPKTVTETGADPSTLLGAGEFFSPVGADMSMTCCIPCPITPLTDYAIGTFAWLEVTAPVCCDATCVDTIVTWDGIDHLVEPGCTWTYPHVECRTNDKTLTIAGPHTQSVWTFEEITEC